MGRGEGKYETYYSMKVLEGSAGSYLCSTFVCTMLKESWDQNLVQGHVSNSSQAPHLIVVALKAGNHLHQQDCRLKRSHMLPHHFSHFVTRMPV